MSDDATDTTAAPATDDASAPAETTASAGSDLGTPTGYPTEPFVLDDVVSEQPDLPRRAAFANLGDVGVLNTWSDNMEITAEAGGLEYVTANADFDPATNIEQINTFLTSGVGAVFVVDFDEAAQRPVIRDGMNDGVAMFTVNFGPSTTQMLADQYATGEQAARWMVERVNEDFGGEAKILLVNADNNEGLVPRSVAIRDVIAEAGDGFEIVSDQVGDPQTQEYGFEMMNTILQSNPEVNVVIGSDTIMLGALAALEAAGVADPSRYLLVGIDGEEQSIATVKRGGTPLAASVSFALPAVGALAGVFATRWLDGLAIPSVVSFNPITLDSAEVIEQFEADMADPLGIVGTDKQDTYFTMLGRISYESRDSYYDGSGLPE